ncbi:plasma protease C1 inhibitor-like isoform X1, partial [Acipenser oxyrinchus oxyrinchus]
VGARGNAQTALEEALFLPQNFECLHKELRSLSSRNLLTASQIYVRPGLELQEFFKDQSKEFYGEGPQLLTNDSEANVRMVNEWVAEHTEHKITRLVDDVPATTELLLLNAIYYQGTVTGNSTACLSAMQSNTRALSQETAQPVCNAMQSNTRALSQETAQPVCNAMQSNTRALSQETAQPVCLQCNAI